MYNISELNEMSDLDLKAVAEGMGLKKIDLSKKEELVYRILDQQAIDRASASTAERKQRKDRAAEAGSPSDESAKPQKKRGRKKKEPAESGSASAPQPVQDNTQTDTPATIAKETAN